MASTNKTTNYELSQFLGTDKPAWLSDYNTDMSKIDAQMKLNADAAATAQGDATSAGTAVGTLANLTTDAKTNTVAAINEVDAHADAAATTASTAAVNASAALADIAKFDLGTEVNLTVVSNVGTVLTNTLKLRKDSTNSIYKLYGQIDVSNLAGVSGTITLTISTNSGLNPSTAYDVNCAGLLRLLGTDTAYESIGVKGFHVNTDGTITLTSDTLDGSISLYSIYFWPCLYFNKSFGD